MSGIVLLKVEAHVWYQGMTVDLSHAACSSKILITKQYTRSYRQIHSTMKADVWYDSAPKAVAASSRQVILHEE